MGGWWRETLVQQEKEATVEAFFVPFTLRAHVVGCATPTPPRTPHPPPQPEGDKFQRVNQRVNECAARILLIKNIHALPVDCLRRL